MYQVTGKSAEILDLAERHVRTVGYNGFSFRDLASEAGIKSASVHYHFPTKGNLGAAVARRYADRFFEIMGDPLNPKKSPRILTEAFIGAFRGALNEDGRMCLFCILGAEFAALPPEVQHEVRSFFNKSSEWLAQVLGRTATGTAASDAELKARARSIIACLEGAMMVARANDQLSIFDDIVGHLRRAHVVP